MMNDFRVQSLSIEGFKGFTSRQEIDLKGRHVFLLGHNGNGKSSIIEAIRWGLIGSTRRPNEVVANRSYTEACRVIIKLMRGQRQWSLRRTLIRGISGGSDAALLNEQGEECSIREIMPQLDSADAGEGTYIVFASQSPPLRRQPQDLTPFERTVFNHLGLTHPRSLLSQIDDFLSGQTLAEHELGITLNNIEEGINKQVQQVKVQQNFIFNSPPWGTDRVPSLSESETKAKALLADIIGKSSSQSLAGMSLESLIEQADNALKSKKSQTELINEHKQIVGFRGKLESLLDIQSRIKSQKLKMQDIRSQIHITLAGVSIDEFRKNVMEKQAEEDTLALRSQIVLVATSLLRLDSSDSVLCPICGSQCHRYDLEELLQDAASKLDDRSISDLAQLKDQISGAEGLERQIQFLDNKLTELFRQERTIKESIEATDLGELIPRTDEDIQEAIKRCVDAETSTKNRIDSNEEWIRTRQATLSNLNRESSFHSLQRDLRKLQESENRIEDAKKAYYNLVTFGESVRIIRQTVETCLTERLGEGLPGVSENLSRIFVALVRHSWYDRLEIARDKLPKLELRVTSSHDILGAGDPIDVLNGQAESALELVPYFAFSQTEDAQTEIYLVLLDDPTRAFDEEHIRILVEQLANLGRHVQLIVASQETERFRALLPQHFDTGSYAIVEPAKWSRSGGPELSVEYG